VLTIAEGMSSIESVRVVGLYSSWADCVAKAKSVLDKGVRGGGGDFWCSEEDGGYREENEDDFEDNTGRAEPTDDRPVELASAKHGEGDYGQMMIFAQRATTP